MALCDLLVLSSREADSVTSGFPTVYTAARLWVAGAHEAKLQDWDWFRRQSAACGFTSTDVFWGNPPSLSLLLAPVAWLPPAKARVVWTVVSLLAWFAGVEWLRRAVAPAGDRLTGWLAGMSLAAVAALYFPFRANLHQGQIYSFLSFLVCATCALWLKGRPFGAGVFAGAAVALKGYGVQFIALAFLKRDRRMVGGAAASFAAMAGLASLRLGIHSWSDFLTVHLGDYSFSGTAVPALQTIRSFAGVAMLPVYHPGGTPPVLGKTVDAALSLLSFAVQLVVLVWLARDRGAKGSDQRAGAGVIPPSRFSLAACVAAGLIFSPRAEEHAYSLGLASLVLLVPALDRISAVSLGTIVAGIILAWPFHFQTRSVLDGLDLVAAYPRLWGALLVLFLALLGEKGLRKAERLPSTGKASSAIGIAWITGLFLILLYVKPWRDPADGPILIVSRTKANAISCFRLDLDEREAFSVPVSCIGPFGVALSPDRRWLYSACTDNSRVSVIDLRRRLETRALDAPRLPAWARARPGASEVWVSNEASGTVTIYDTVSTATLAEVHTGSGPSDICFTSDGKTAFVANEASGIVSWVDAGSRKKVRDIAVGKVPQGLALTQDGQSLVVANYGSNSVSVIGVGEQREVARIDTCRGPVDVTISPVGGEGLAYVSCFEDGAVAVLDLRQVRELTRVQVGSHLLGISALPSENRVYVCSEGTDEIVVLRGGPKPGILRRIHVAGSPSMLQRAP